MICLIFRSTLFQLVVCYSTIEERKPLDIIKSTMIQELRTIGDTNNLDKLIDSILKHTADKLAFTSEKCSVDPHEMTISPKTNCVGYANYFVSVFNELSETKNHHWQAVACRGEIHFLGINVHQYFKSGFLQDHDYVKITDRKLKTTIIVDPSLFDYTGIDRVNECD